MDLVNWSSPSMSASIKAEVWAVCWSIIASTRRPSVRQVELGWRWVMQHDNDPKQQKIYNRMSEKEKNWGVALVQSPDINMVERFWWNLKRAVHKPMLPTSMNWSNDVRDWWCFYRELLFQIIAAKGGSRSCWIMGWTFFCFLYTLLLNFCLVFVNQIKSVIFHVFQTFLYI